MIHNRHITERKIIPANTRMTFQKRNIISKIENIASRIENKLAQPSNVSNILPFVNI